ncbi:recombinase family protein [Streptomyces sp. NBC_00444]|uniref:recombinase family protein n=1 Tax=Streptomyces sp. NBC_00444 TaxID=2975744 RepID=UPI002E243D70
MPYDPSYLHLVFPNTTFEAYLYGRASRDPNKRGDSVEDQLVAGRTLCDSYNWHIADEFKDTGLSASRHAKQVRDDFEDLITVIEETPSRKGVLRIVVAYEASRYYRDLEAYVRLRAACLSAGVLLCYKGTVYDLSRSDDRQATAMDAIRAEGEADDIRDRNLRTAARTATAGDPHGRLLFGYARRYETVNGQLRCVEQYENPATGPYVFKSLVHIDQGNSVASLIRCLNSEPDAERADGLPWTTRNVRLMLLNRAYLGERKNHGKWTKATWPPIKGLETPAGRAMFNRVTAKLTDPERRTQRGSEVAHLLSLIALCGPCGDHAMLAASPHHGGVWQLRCQIKGDVAIREEWMDAYVEEAVMQWFRNKKEAMAALVPDDEDVEVKVAEAQRRINGIEEQLREAQQLAEEFDDETGRFKLSSAALSSMEQRLEPKLEQERKKLRDMTGVSPLLLSLLNAEDPDAVWSGRPATDGGEGTPALTLEQKREVIRKVVTIRLHKSQKRGRRVERGRIRLSFVGQPGFRDRPLRVPETGSAQGGPAAPAPAGAAADEAG